MRRRWCQRSRPFTAHDGMRALEILEHASAHLERQFSVSMQRSEAVSHFGARRILFQKRVALFNEMSEVFGLGAPITQAEIDTAIAKVSL